MKYSFLILLSFNCFASNWMNHDVIKANGVAAYQLEKECPGKCYDIGSNPSKVYSEVDVEVDDLNKPVYDKKSYEACSDEQDCSLKTRSKVCETDYSASYKTEDLIVFCMKLTGYEKKTEKQMQIDEVKLAAYQQELSDLQAKAIDDAKMVAALKLMECGKKAIARMLIQNQPKNLSESQIAQINSTYAPIKNLLETGSLITAKQAIQAVNADGVLVKTEDKEALIAEIDKCL